MNKTSPGTYNASTWFRYIYTPAEEQLTLPYRSRVELKAIIIIYLVERSEFLIATYQKKNLWVCSTNIGFSVGYVLCTRYVCTTLYDTRYVLCTRYVWYQVRIMYQIRMYHTCRCTINSTAVSLFVYSLVGGGTHDTYVPPKKQLYRYLFIR